MATVNGEEEAVATVNGEEEATPTGEAVVIVNGEVEATLLNGEAEATHQSGEVVETPTTEVEVAELEDLMVKWMISKQLKIQHSASEVTVATVAVPLVG
jgi:type V secretory pathway adhesin AidA